MNKIFLIRLKVWCDGERKLNDVVIAENKEEAIQLLIEKSGESFKSYLEDAEWFEVGESKLYSQILARETC